MASVNHLGEVTGVSTGTATITCTLAGQTVGRTVTVTSPTQTLSTWYVRPNGGTRYDANVTSGQCSGAVNADYPGSGTNQPCAFNNPMYLFTDESSSSAYTGAVQSGDTAIIYPAPAATPYLIIYKTLGSTANPWVTNQGSAITIPSGTSGPPDEDSWEVAIRTVLPDPDHTGNRAAMLSTGNVAFVIWGAQNIIINGIDVGTGVDCDSKSLAAAFSFPCPDDVIPFIFMSDSFASNIQIQNTRTHGGLQRLDRHGGARLGVGRTVLRRWAPSMG